ncbi:SAM-dependent methyltransferase [Telmatospirillum siberiense]|uniref:Class I SAM-dependent methyltransferase n=1 Tax=Telmatospirillum siberiense TaxID=382514 RepID=A0A2N3Q0W6_9PROT|nr:methyltransferase domain-containing protein [Telmatospirillum siberiense]PKU26282.1 class I SAM-dependent methyltransferase [Telmatospirillum siberiense]
MPHQPATNTLYENLPRPGQGVDSCTREAIRLLPPLRTPPAIIDLGCGRGHQTVALASHFKAPVIAVDDNQTALDDLIDTANAAGVEALIKPRLGSLTDIPDAPESFDLVWSENGVRTLGMERALACWAPLLRKRGVLVVGDCCWVLPNPPAEAVTFWRDRYYPQMTDVASVHAIAKHAGLRVYDTYTLPRSIWRSEYFEPLSRRIAKRRGEAAGDPRLDADIHQAEAEIQMFERWGDRFQYMFYLMRPI